MIDWHNLIYAGLLLGVALFYLLLGFYLGRKTALPPEIPRPKRFDPGPAEIETNAHDPFHQAIYGEIEPTMKGERN